MNDKDKTIQIQTVKVYGWNDVEYWWMDKDLFLRYFNVGYPTGWEREVIYRRWFEFWKPEFKIIKTRLK